MARAGSTNRSGRLRVGLVRAALVVFGLTAGLAIAELALRALGSPPEHVVFPPRPEGGLQVESVTTAIDLGPDPALYVETPAGKRMRPNTRVLVRNHHLSGRDVLIRTNDQGFRNAPLEGKQGQRVLFLGDSITLADYLPEEDTFVRLVQDLARSDGRNMETINAGIGAVGTANELAILVERGVALAPDVVVLGFYLNDAQPSPGVQRVRLPRTLEWSWLARRAARVVPRLTGGESEGDLPAATLEAWRAEAARRVPPGGGDPRRDRGAFGRLVADAMSDWGAAWSDGAWDRLDPLFREFRRLADLHGFLPVVVVFPVRLQVEADHLEDWPQRRAREIADRLGLPVLDLLPALRRAYRSQRAPLFFDHCHHTRHGNRVIAREVYAFLQTAAS